MGTVTGDSSLQTDVLENLTDASRYRQWLADLGRPYLGRDPVEIGSGTGEYAVEWIPSVTTFTATEAESSRYQGLRERFADDPVVRVRYMMLGDPAGAADASSNHSAAVAYNVLEHIPDHVGALRAMRNLVRPGGAVVLVVPAFPSAMSQFDRAIGHRRRYTKRSLADALTAADLSIEQLRYINPIGLLNWYIAVKTLRMTPQNGFALRIFDAMVVPISRWLDRFPVPFGQSVFAVARVPTEAP